MGISFTLNPIPSLSYPPERRNFEYKKPTHNLFVTIGDSIRLFGAPVDL